MDDDDLHETLDHRVASRLPCWLWSLFIWCRSGWFSSLLPGREWSQGGRAGRSCKGRRTCGLSSFPTVHWMLIQCLDGQAESCRYRELWRLLWYVSVLVSSELVWCEVSACSTSSERRVRVVLRLPLRTDAIRLSIIRPSSKGTHASCHVLTTPSKCCSRNL